jgi:hypothetical protein
MERLLEFWKKEIIDSSLVDGKKELEDMRLARIEKLKEQEENGKKRKNVNFPCKQLNKRRNSQHEIPESRELGSPEHQIGFMIYHYRESLKYDQFDSEYITQLLLDKYDNIDLDIVWDKWVKRLSDDEINDKYEDKQKKMLSFEIICDIEKYLMMKNMSRKRLPKNPEYKGIKGYRFIHGKKNYGPWSPWNFIAPMGEIIDPFVNIGFVIDEYEKSLFSIPDRANVEKIRGNLQRDIMELKSNSEKRDFLIKVMKILVTREMEDDGIFEWIDFEY